MALSKWLLLAPTLLANPALGRGSWQADGWELLDQDNGIDVYRKSFPGSDVKGVGGEGLVKAPIAKILWVLMDHEHKPQWIDKFQSSYTIEELSPLVDIQYAAFNMPFPVKDRDFVYRYEFSVSPEQDAVIVAVQSVEHPSAPASKTIGVRGEIVKGRYILYPEGPEETRVIAEYLADPKGSLPSWVVNLVQRNWPSKTLINLRRQVGEPYVKDWEPYKLLLQAKMKNAP